MEIIQDGYVCVDCCFMIANGILPSNPEEYPAGHEGKIADATFGWVLSGDDEHPDLEFSRSRCETCGSDLGGQRYWAVKLG